MLKRLTEEQIAFFDREGYLVVTDLFSDDDLSPLCDEIDANIAKTTDSLATQGRLTNRWEGEPLETRLTRLLTDNPAEAGTFFSALEGKGGGGHTGPAMFAMLTHPALLDAMEDILGTTELVASSVYRIRPKVPHLGRGVVPWHQDSGYIAPRCDKEMIVTCWIPLVDSTLENGCLSVLPRTHTGEVVRHYTGGNAHFLVILDEDLPADVSQAIPVPVPRGGALLMTNRTPHCSTPNSSDTIRWSIDLRYQGKEVPNNLDANIDLIDPTAPEITMACYAPEGDFVVRSAEDPSSVASYAEFVRRRVAFENARIPGTGRGWQPVPK